jgi:hypothetical protein
MSVEILPLLTGAVFLAVWALVVGIVVETRRDGRRSCS